MDHNPAHLGMYNFPDASGHFGPYDPQRAREGIARSKRGVLCAEPALCDKPAQHEITNAVARFRLGGRRFERTSHKCIPKRIDGTSVLLPIGWNKTRRPSGLA